MILISNAVKTELFLQNFYGKRTYDIKYAPYSWGVGLGGGMIMTCKVAAVVDVFPVDFSLGGLMPQQSTLDNLPDFLTYKKCDKKRTVWT